MHLRFKSILIAMISLLFWTSVFAASNEEVLLKSALQAYQSNDLNQCVKGFYSLTQIQPQKGLYWFNLGNCLFLGGQPAKASSAYEKVIKLQSPLAPAAMLYQARAQAKLGNKDKARELLVDLQNKKLPPGLRSELALECYEQGLYAETENQLEQIPPPLDGKAQMLLALSLMKQNKNAEAEKALKSLSAATDLSVTDRTSARDLLLSLKTPAAIEKTYGLFLDVAYGTTSNAYLEGRSFEPVSSPLLRASLGAHYRYYQSSAWSQKISYVLDYENPTSAPELNTQTHTVQIPVAYFQQLKEFTVTPYLAAQLWDGSMAYQKTGAHIRAAFSPATGWGGGCDLDLSSQKGANESLSYLSGSSYAVRPFVGLTQGAWSLQLSWLIGSDGTQDIVYSDGSRLPLQHTYQGPGLRAAWRATAASSLALQVLSLERSYKNNSLPEDKHRQDQEINASLKYTYGFSRGWAAYGLVEYNPNKSTLGSDDVRDKNYDYTNALAGIAWDVF